MTQAVAILPVRPLVVGCGVGFIAYAAASTLWSKGEAFHSLAFLSILFGSFTLGLVLPSIRGIWLAFLGFLLVNLSLHFYGYPWGLYGGPNLLGCALALGLASALVYRLWLFIPFLAYGLWLTQSRGAILGASAALFLWLWPKSKTTTLGAVALGLVAILASDHGQADGVWQRLGIWQDTLNHLTPWGSGFGSFSESYWALPVKLNMGFSRPEHAYNDFLELTFELGLGAILLWVFLIGVLSESGSEAKLILYTYFALALTFFPLYVWFIGPLVALTLGHLSRENNGNQRYQ